MCLSEAPIQRAIASKQAESVGFSVIFASEHLRRCALACEVCCQAQSDREVSRLCRASAQGRGASRQVVRHLHVSVELVEVLVVLGPAFQMPVLHAGLRVWGR